MNPGMFMCVAFSFGVTLLLLNYFLEKNQQEKKLDQSFISSSNAQSFNAGKLDISPVPGSFFPQELNVSWTCQSITPSFLNKSEIKSIINATVFLTHCSHASDVSFQVSIPGLPYAVLRGRLLGDIIVEMKFISSGNCSWTFQRQLPQSVYEARIELIYRKFNPEDLKESHSYSLEHVDILKGYLFQIPDKFCSAGSTQLPGYWSVGTLPLSRSNWWEHIDDLRAALGHTDVKYNIEGCHFLSLKMLRRCFNGEEPWKKNVHLCMAGDSENRQLYATIYDMIYDYKRAPYHLFGNWGKKDAFQQKMLEEGVGSNMHCFGDMHGYSMIAGDLYQPIAANKTCTVFMINFGQWHLSWHGWRGNNDGEPVSASMYKSFVRKALNQTKTLFKQPGTEIFWATNHPFMGPGENFRNTETLKMLSDVSKNVAKEVNVKIIDINNILTAMWDVSFDGAHYDGPYEREIGIAATHEICMNELKKQGFSGHLRAEW